MIKNLILSAGGSVQDTGPATPTIPTNQVFYQTFDFSTSNWNDYNGIGPTTVGAGANRIAGKSGYGLNCNAINSFLYYNNAAFTQATNGLFELSADIWIPPGTWTGKYDSAIMLALGVSAGTGDVRIGVDTGTNNLWVIGIPTSGGGVKFDPGARSRWCNVKVRRLVAGTVETLIDDVVVYSRAITTAVGGNRLYINGSSAYGDIGCSNSIIDNVVFKKF